MTQEMTTHYSWRKTNSAIITGAFLKQQILSLIHYIFIHTALFSHKSSESCCKTSSWHWLSGNPVIS